MGAASRRKAEAEFDEKKVIARYLDALRKIATPVRKARAPDEKLSMG
jgi:hypothetical protein